MKPLLRVSSGTSAKHFDIHNTTASGTDQVNYNVVEMPMDLDNDTVLQPLLVDKWGVSDDGLTWTFTLREGLTFHDGTPVTARDIVGVMNRIKDEGSFINYIKDNFGPESFADFVQLDDNMTFSLHLIEPTAMATVVFGPQHIQPSITSEAWWSRPQDEVQTGTVIGTGPFTFKEWEPGAFWIMERWVDFKPRTETASGRVGKKTAYFDTVRWIEIPDETTRVAALTAGEVDVVQEFGQDSAEEVDANPKLTLLTIAIPNQPQGIMNFQKEPFSNVEARRALMMAYDYEKAMRAGVGPEKYWRLCGTISVCGTAFESQRGLEGIYLAKRIDDARAIIEAEGYAGTTVIVLSAEERSVMRGGANVAREVLEDIGFKVDFRAVDWPTIGSMRKTVDEWDFFITWQGPNRVGQYGPLSDSFMDKDGWYNMYDDPIGEMARLKAALGRTTSAEDAKVILGDIQQLFYDDAIFLRLGEFFGTWGKREELKFVGATSDNVQGTRQFARYRQWYGAWIE